jgi:hypothetical protein
MPRGIGDGHDLFEQVLPEQAEFHWVGAIQFHDLGQ